MPWAPITESDLLTRLSGTELTEIRAADLGAGQPDPVAPIISQAVDMVRGYVAACERNELGAAGTIPSRLLGTALDIVAIEIAKRLPAEVGVTDSRVTAHQDAIRRLEQVAACNFAISDPDSETDQTSAPSPKFTTPVRNFSRAAQDGI